MLLMPGIRESSVLCVLRDATHLHAAWRVVKAGRPALMSGRGSYPAVNRGARGIAGVDFDRRSLFQVSALGGSAGLQGRLWQVPSRSRHGRALQPFMDYPRTDHDRIDQQLTEAFTVGHVCKVSITLMKGPTSVRHAHVTSPGSEGTHPTRRRK